MLNAQSRLESSTAENRLSLWEVSLRRPEAARDEAFAAIWQVADADGTARAA